MKCLYIDVRVFEDQELFQKTYQSILWPERREQIMRCKNKKDQLLSLGASFLLNRELPSLLDPALPLPPVSIGKHGKPFLEGHEDLYFNLSHSGCYAAFTAASVPCGVDVEHHRTRYDKLASRFFTANEQQYIADAPDPDLAFLLIWTRKESFLKCSGEGLSRDLLSFDVISPGSLNVNFFEKELPGHFLTVCTSGMSSAGTEAFEGFFEVSPLQNDR